MLSRTNFSILGAATVLAIGLFGGITGTFASFVSQTANRGNGYAMTSLYAPSALTATASPRNGALAWQAGRNGNGYRIQSAPAPTPTSSGCAGAAFTTLTTVSGLNHTDARFAPQGTWHCYQVETNHGSWTSVEANPVVSAQLGFVVTAVQVTNGGTAGQLDTGDRISVTFNHPVTPATGPLVANSVCAVAGGPIVLGSAAATGACSTSEATSLGQLTGGTADRAVRYGLTSAAWSNGNTTVTLTLGTRTNGNRAPVVSGSWTMTPTTDATKLLSATGAHHVCDTNAGGGNCTRVVTGSF